MDRKLYLIKEGEISLKGGNRDFFEKKLRNNLKLKLRPYHSLIQKQKGRIFAYIDTECPDDYIDNVLSTTFGITGYARAYTTEKKLEAIVDEARRILPNSTFKQTGSFKVNAKREDKSFALTSHEISIVLADVVHEIFPDLTVDLDNPDYILHCEIRSDAYLYTSEKKGIGGLPVGTAGKGMLLLSGGIDSPVAGVEMSKRGVKLDSIYFHAYPYTSDMALEKVKKLAKKIAPYLQGTNLYVVPFTKGQEFIRDNGYEDEATLMFRAAMMQTATKIAKQNDAKAIVTGEALSQVASQTLDAMNFTNSMTDLVVLRPLVAMDKEEIIEKARKIDTYDTSILPYEDCCVVFSPKHPVTRPIKEVARKHYDALSIEEIIDEAISNATVFTFDSMGNEVKEDE